MLTNKRAGRKTQLVGCVVLASVALCLVVPALVEAQTTALAFGRCGAAQVAVATPGLQCATLTVPADREDANLGSISLAVQRIAPSGPQVGTIVLLAGGPGQPALPAFEEILAPLARLPALRGYELVSFDQRGTGQSGALGCPGLLRTGLAALAACGEMLGSARADYTSQDSVDDLEDLRQALGGLPLSLYAVSYGGKVAAMYAREHPDGTARMVLDSPVPLDGTDALDSQRLRALRRVLDAGVCGGGACRSFAEDSYGDLVRLMATLHRRPMRAQIFNSHGQRETVTVSEAGVYSLISVMDLSQDLRALIPAAIAAAIKGDAAPLGRLTSGLGAPSPSGAEIGLAPAAGHAPADGAPTGVLGSAVVASAGSASSALSLTLFDATACVESPLPWSPESSPATRTATLPGWVAQLPAGITAPFGTHTVVSASRITLCKGWPATPSAPPPPAGISATPTLILSGDEDLREPYEQDLTVASGYSDVQLLRIPDTGHSTVGTDPTGCAGHAMIAFLTDSQAPSSCPTPRESQALPPPPSSLSELSPADSSSTLAGRGATAVALSIEEVLGQPSLTGGGLHGGSWQLQGTRLAFRGFSDVPGVSVSGSIRLTSSIAHLTISGVVSGALKLHGRMLSGRLNGAEVDVRLVH
jgi:pimeloyl-ACP methyl ester carboxylesterase